MSRLQQVTVLGATGSVGLSTLDVIARHPDRYQVFALTGFTRLPHTSEALAIASGRPLSQVLATLTELELEGQVICESGRWLARGQLL